MNKYSLSLLAVIFSTVSLYSNNTHAEDFYEIVDLGSFVDSSYSNAYSINASNQIVGHGDGDGFLAHAFMSENGQFSSLGFLEDNLELTNKKSFAFAVNDMGIAVGYSLEESAANTGLEIPVIYDTSDFSITKIPSFESLVEGRNELENARAIAINNNGVIVGTGIFNEPDDIDDDGNAISVLFVRAFIYDINSEVLIKINPLENDLANNITLRDIDDSGYAVGISAEKNNFGFTNKKVVGIDTNSSIDAFELTIFETISQDVSAINSFKKVVGVAVDLGGTYQTAYLHDINSSITVDLGVLNPNFPFSEAFDINDNDQIVGISQTKSQPSIFSGFIYENGEMKDLTKLIGCDTGWTIHEARSINNNGFITGTGLLNGEARAFMLRPIPDQTAPVCEDDSLNIGSGSPSLFSLLSLLGLLTVRKRYLKH